jgi:GDSL-like Lipase/Acylhydrolase family
MTKVARRGALALVVALSTCAIVLGTPGAVPASGATPRLFYLSLGDSLAQGYQPGYTDGSETLHGFSNRVVTDVAKKYRLVLENYGCGGATSASILYTDGCRYQGLANNGVAYPTKPQSVAAIAFIRAHRAHIGLISLSIGWNDFDSCVGMADPSSCVTPTLAAMQANLTILGKQLRAAAGAKVPIVAMTYSDPDLADWLQGTTGKETASEWITELRSYVNPAIVNAYRPSHVNVLDITTAYGTYVPWSDMVTTSSYGVIPYSVAQICKDTWMCKVGNEDANNFGYTLIANQIAKFLLRRH